MPNAYVKMPVDWLEAVSPLTDAQRGRLFTALLQYAKTGDLPDFRGNERFLFPILRAQVDQDLAARQALLEMNRRNGKLGGRPRKNRAVFSETQKSQEKEEEKDKDKEKEKDSSLGAGAPERERGDVKSPAQG